MDPETAAAQLRSAQHQRDLIADRSASPPGYHVMLGIMVGLFVASSYFQELLPRMTVIALFLLGCGGLVLYYRRTKGIWINGNRPGPAGRIATVGALAAAALYVIGYTAGHWWPVVPLICGVIAAIEMTVTGYRWDAVYAKELRSRQ
ncbi:hypothetical protein [Antrihabitans cavernicola]|uniref:Uncharacterized protein n=1 Tax=Antrihabitans cavernicola TaxID=2495913 RepID=A0A5A7SEN5_9NOCA|nr:hypothetical protein [Spelaeibacter cavernicola]KAA0023879.1 hypothetical protein FOY51_04635 [Spelaeibacter cavernicola]